MAATWKTDPKDRTNFTDILDAFIDNNCTCRQRLSSHAGRKGQATSRASCELPSLHEVDEEADDSLTAVIAAGRNSCVDDDQKDEQDEACGNFSILRQQQENPYMVPVDLEVVLVHSPD